MTAKWEPWDPHDPPAYTLRDVIAAVPAFVVLVLIFLAIVVGIPVLAAAASQAR